ncbi:hypothetical protein LINGRAHAP2_LOCUS10709, partial [Linum grandiflorum]
DSQLRVVHGVDWIFWYLDQHILPHLVASSLSWIVQGFGKKKKEEEED